MDFHHSAKRVPRKPTFGYRRVAAKRSIDDRTQRFPVIVASISVHRLAHSARQTPGWNRRVQSDQRERMESVQVPAHSGPESTTAFCVALHLAQSFPNRPLNVLALTPFIPF